MILNCGCGNILLMTDRLCRTWSSDFLLGSDFDLINYCVYKFLSWFAMIVLCCVVLYDYVHCLLLRRNNKWWYITLQLYSAFIATADCHQSIYGLHFIDELHDAKIWVVYVTWAALQRLRTVLCYFFFLPTGLRGFLGPFGDGVRLSCSALSAASCASSSSWRCRSSSMILWRKASRGSLNAIRAASNDNCNNNDMHGHGLRLTLISQLSFCYNQHFHQILHYLTEWAVSRRCIARPPPVKRHIGTMVCCMFSKRHRHDRDGRV